MAEVNGLTPMMAVQAVNAELRRCEDLVSSDRLEDAGEVQSLISSFERTADELRRAYDSEWRVGCNLPPYDELIRT